MHLYIDLFTSIGAVEIENEDLQNGDEISPSCY